MAQSGMLGPTRSTSAHNGRRKCETPAQDVGDWSDKEDEHAGEDGRNSGEDIGRQVPEWGSFVIESLRDRIPALYCP